MKTFNPDDKVTKMVKKHEGFRQFPYRDTAGFLTVAYGRNLDINGISESEATQLLLNDLRDALDLALTKIPVASKLSENRLMVLVMMVFNMGIGGVLKFTKMLSAIEKGDYNEAAKNMLDSKWAKQVGSRSHELAEIMITDKF